MPTRRPLDLPERDVTPEAIFQGRRRLVRLLALSPLALAACSQKGEAGAPTPPPPPPAPGTSLSFTPNAAFHTQGPLTSWQDVTHYNNYYEFGTSKSDPARNSGAFKPRPWSVAVGGECEAPGIFALEDLIKGIPLEQRIYRHRCVEAWSMVIPWVGFPLGTLLKRFRPTSRAKYVAFTTVDRPAQMPGLSYPVLDWPYREGLRIDEAMHPLTLLAVGVYGRVLPNQNGAPLRLVVPWKYGFKSTKAIVQIAFSETRPVTSWNQAAPDRYGFYANVNPDVGTVPWSQHTERRIAGAGFSLFGNRIATHLFNSYADQVASLYAGMDLRHDY